MAGHSKWAQIKHKKAATDAKRARLFSKAIREIIAATRAGGPSPDTNTRLRRAAIHAGSIGVPKDHIAKSISRASGAAHDTPFEEFLYEATAPGGVLLLI